MGPSSWKEACGRKVGNPKRGTLAGILTMYRGLLGNYIKTYFLHTCNTKCRSNLAAASWECGKSALLPRLWVLLNRLPNWKWNTKMLPACSERAARAPHPCGRNVCEHFGPHAAGCASLQVSNVPCVSVLKKNNNNFVELFVWNNRSA